MLVKLASTASRALKASKERWEILVLREKWAPKVIEVTMESHTLGQQAILDLQGLKGLKDHKEIKVFRVLLDLREAQESGVIPDSQDTQGLLVLMA
jgi:hypothetical protein